jgi:hypothetical protein
MTTKIGIIENRKWNEHAARWAFTLRPMDGSGGISCLTAEFCNGEPSGGKQVAVQGDWLPGNQLFEVHQIQLA